MDNRKKVAMIGELPPPYGGVTIKNQLIFKKIFQSHGAQFIDLMICSRNPLKLPSAVLKISKKMVICHAIIIGVGTAFRIKILLCLQWLIGGKKGLNKVAIIVMGGQLHTQVLKDKLLQKLLNNTGSLWVESESMICALNNIGIKQTYYFPNGRDDSLAQPPRDKPSNYELRLVFFSRICVEKGVDIIIDAFKILMEKHLHISLDFYGEISENIRYTFKNFIEKYSCHYHGVFDSVNNNVYRELNQYDVILLPTKWEGEGVPGALVESKMAGITAIVSDWNVNYEVVHNEIEGIVLSSATAETLAEEIFKLYCDPAKVKKLKIGAFESRKRYSIDAYGQILTKTVLG